MPGSPGKTNQMTKLFKAECLSLSPEENRIQNRNLPILATVANMGKTTGFFLYGYNWGGIKLG
jgi:hypothetical protein